MLSGKVKWFNYKKGYGFITPDEGDKDVFVHITAMREANLHRLEEGQEISYELKEENGKTRLQKGIEDLEKAQFYLQYEINLLKNLKKNKQSI